MRDPVEKLYSADGYPQNLPADVVGVSADTTEAFMVSDNQNININNNFSDIAVNDSNMTMTEQVALHKGRSRTCRQRWIQRSPNQLRRS